MLFALRTVKIGVSGKELIRDGIHFSWAPHGSVRERSVMQCLFERKLVMTQ